MELDLNNLDDTFRLSIETRTSMEDLFLIHYDGDFNKVDLPYEFKVKVPKGGYTDIRIYVNNKFVESIKRNATEVE